MKHLLYLILAAFLSLTCANAQGAPPNKTTIPPDKAQASPDKPPAPDFEYAEPAPGCGIKVPTVESVQGHCKLLAEQSACNAEKKWCEWSPPGQIPGGGDYAGSCQAKLGAYLADRSSPPLPPLPHDSLLPKFELPDLATPEQKQAEKVAATAYDAAAVRQYDRAVLLYTQAIKIDAEGEYHVNRGLVYEYKGDTTKAVADYCQGLIYGVDWDLQSLADERIAQLTRQPDAKQTPRPMFMQNGVLHPPKHYPVVAPLTVETPKDANYVLKLVTLQGDTEEMLIYVRRGTTYQTLVPLGTYHIRGASGMLWYGEKVLFGEATSYFKLSDKDGLDDEFKFERVGNRFMGFRLKLIKQEGGNMATDPIDPKDF